jgi:hypothetical protein
VQAVLCVEEAWLLRWSNGDITVVPRSLVCSNPEVHEQEYFEKFAHNDELVAQLVHMGKWEQATTTLVHNLQAKLVKWHQLIDGTPLATSWGLYRKWALSMAQHEKGLLLEGFQQRLAHHIAVACNPAHYSLTSSHFEWMTITTLEHATLLHLSAGNVTFTDNRSSPDRCSEAVHSFKTPGELSEQFPGIDYKSAYTQTDPDARQEGDVITWETKPYMAEGRDLRCGTAGQFISHLKLHGRIKVLIGHPTQKAKVYVWQSLPTTANGRRYENNNYATGVFTLVGESLIIGVIFR